LRNGCIGFSTNEFWHCDRREFDLRELCCEHIGLSRNYDTANLKRKLLSGIQELEERGFIRAASQRFKKVRRGQWVRRLRESSDDLAPAADRFCCA